MRIVQGSHMKNGMAMGFYKIVDKMGRDVEYYYYEIGNEADRKRALRNTRAELGGSGHGHGGSGHGGRMS
jgi:hypothetical protein